VNRNEKLKTLQDALQGKASQLEQLHQQRRKDAMPYQNATGYIAVDCCPAEWQNMVVMDCEAAIDDDTRPRSCTFAEWLLLPIARSGIKSGCGLVIDTRSDQFDTLPLAGMMLELRSFGRKYIYGGTIGNLRRYYNQSAASIEKPGILLFVSYDINRLLPNRPTPPNETSRKDCFAY
jgi:hypothetical protein